MRIGKKKGAGIEKLFVTAAAGAALCAFLSQGLDASQSVTLGWTPSTSTNISGYFVYEGGVSGAYTNKMDVGNISLATIPQLIEGGKYFFRVSAYNVGGLEGIKSDEVSYEVPLTLPAPGNFQVRTNVSGNAMLKSSTSNVLAIGKSYTPSLTQSSTNDLEKIVPHKSLPAPKYFFKGRSPRSDAKKED